MVKFASFLAGLFGLAFGIVALGAGIGIWSALTQGSPWNGVVELVLISVVLAAIATGLQKWHDGLKEEEEAAAATASPPEVERRAVSAPAVPTGTNLLGQDAMLSTYYGYPVDWRARWEKASTASWGVIPFGARPYWIPNPEGSGVVPLTSLAFWGERERVLTAGHPETPRHLLNLMADDPSERVRSIVAQRGTFGSP